MCESFQLCLTLYDPMDGSRPGSSVHGIHQGRKLEWVMVPSSKGSSQPRDWTHASYTCLLHSQADSLPLKQPAGGGLVSKSCPNLATPWTVVARLLCPWDCPGKNAEAGCHFLLQGIFPTQELNLGLLHCRQILHQLSYKGSPVPPWKPSYLKPGSKLISQVKWLPGIITRYMVYLFKCFGDYFSH